MASTASKASAALTLSRRAFRASAASISMRSVARSTMCWSTLGGEVLTLVAMLTQLLKLFGENIRESIVATGVIAEGGPGITPSACTRCGGSICWHGLLSWCSGGDGREHRVGRKMGKSAPDLESGLFFIPPSPCSCAANATPIKGLTLLLMVFLILLPHRFLRAPFRLQFESSE